MDKTELCKKLKKTIRKLLIFDDQKPLFNGTGVIVSEDGILLTANHVINVISNLSQPRIVAYSTEENIPEITYQPRLMNLSMSINMPNLAKPLDIDLAILKPLKIIGNLVYLELREEVAPIGTEVLMAGFPDEVSSPLHFDRMLNYEKNAELAKNKGHIEALMENFMRLFFAKSGMIGGMFPINISGNFKNEKLDKPVEAHGAVYWIDNASNHGASGGAVIDYSGKLVGIICEKGETTHSQGFESPKIAVPSGSTMALSHQLISWGLAPDFMN